MCKAFLLISELWRGDVTGRINIGVTASGFDQIRLDCGSNNFQVVIETQADFKGVIYTRGTTTKNTYTMWKVKSSFYLPFRQLLLAKATMLSRCKRWASFPAQDTI